MFTRIENYQFPATRVAAPRGESKYSPLLDNTAYRIACTADQVGKLLSSIRGFAQANGRIAAYDYNDENGNSCDKSAMKQLVVQLSDLEPGAAAAAKAKHRAKNEKLKARLKAKRTESKKAAEAQAVVVNIPVPPSALETPSAVEAPTVEAAPAPAEPATPVARRRRA